MSRRFDDALAAHRAGDWARAEPLYRAVLGLDPEHVDALNLLATLLHRQGRSAEAVPLLGRCLAIAPDFQAARVQLGNALLASGEPGRAVAEYERVLAADPGAADACLGLGNARVRLGQMEDAVTAYRAALAKDPSFFEAALCIGDVALGRGEHEAALAAYRQAEAIAPDCDEALSGQVEALMRLARGEAALAVQRRLVDRKPQSFDARLALGWIHVRSGDRAAARTAFAVAERLCAGAVATVELANGCLSAGDAAAAERLASAAQAQLANPAPALMVLGRVADSRGDVDTAEARYRQALAVDPAANQARFNLALITLLRGDYAAGWPAYEQRYQLKIGARTPVRVPALGFPMWRGEALAGKRVLVVGEQGLGDQIQFLRFVPQLAGRAAAVDVCVAAPLVRLARGVEGVRRVLAGDPAAAGPDYDFWVFLMSLPARFGHVLADLPGKLPSLRPDAEARRRWQGFLPARPAGAPRRVGLVWAGNRQNIEDANRSLAPTQIDAWLRLPGIEWYSLVKGEREAELDGIAAGASVVRMGERLDDFADTAALIEELDLVISVDSAVAHLAGALARPAWVLIPTDADWRWLIDREDSPWYPTLRLYRQQEAGNWDNVLARIAADLEQLTGIPH